MPDRCEDCNGNGVPDDADLSLGTSRNCNGNGRPDECDIADCPRLDPTCHGCNRRDSTHAGSIAADRW